MLKLHSVEIIPGDSGTNTSFSFPIEQTAFHEQKSLFFISAGVPKESNNFSIAVANNGTNQFIPLTPDLVTFNNVPLSKNPLYGCATAHLSLFDAHPVVVTKNDDTTFYMMNDLLSVISATHFNDAQGNEPAHIVGITTDNNGSFEGEGASVVFVALSPTSGTFGTLGSGIGIARLQAETIDQGKKTERSRPFFQILNAGNPLNGFNQPAPLDTTSDAIKIGADLAAIHNNIVDMHWDGRLGRVYLALQITADAGVGNGGKAVATASMNGGFMTIESIVANTAITADSIVAAQVDAGVDISIHKVRTMFTSTRLHYLIVVGGLGSVSATRNRVFALPLVSTHGSSAISGLLANQQSDPVDIFGADFPHRFVNRTLPTLATAPGDVPTSSDPQAIVGGGPAPGDISTILVTGDAVFIATTSVTTDQQPGIFHSQALFDAMGKIKQWTDWRRVAGTASGINGFALDAMTANVWYVPTPGFTVFRTQWALNQSPLATTLNSFFNTIPGGVQGLLDVPSQTPGLNQTLGSRLSFMVASGYRALFIVQTGEDNSALQFGPVNEFNPRFTSFNGTLSGFTSGFKAIELSGGALDELGPIVSAAIVTDNAQAWLIVGGSDGVAVLANEDGTGAIGGFNNGFSSLSPTMKIRKIGHYQNVIRVYASGTNLYVLTPTTLDRISASAATFAASNTIIPTTLATPTAVPNAASFIDVLIAEPFALLGTTGGLLRVGNNSNIATAESTAMVQWTTVVIPESAGSVSKIFAISPTNLTSDFAFGGNIYVLNSLVSNHLSRIYRYSLDVDISQPINDTSITLFNDLFIKGSNTFFFNIGDYRNNVITDGATIFLTKSRYVQNLPFVQLIHRNLRCGEANPLRQSFFPVVAQGFFSLFDVVRNSGSGSWVTPGDFGVYVNE